MLFSKGKTFQFRVADKGDELVMSVKTENERNLWIESINAMVRFIANLEVEKKLPSKASGVTTPVVAPPVTAPAAPSVSSPPPTTAAPTSADVVPAVHSSVNIEAQSRQMFLDLDDEVDEWAMSSSVNIKLVAGRVSIHKSSADGSAVIGSIKEGEIVAILDVPNNGFFQLVDGRGFVSAAASWEAIDGKEEQADQTVERLQVAIDDADYSRVVSLSNSMIVAWAQGDRATFAQIVDANLTMKIDAFGLNLTGLNSVWDVRKQMSDKPLEPHLVHSHTVVGGTVHAIVDVLSPQTGKLTRSSEVTFSFSERSRTVTHYEQVVVLENGMRVKRVPPEPAELKDPAALTRMIALANTMILAWTNRDEAAFKSVVAKDFELEIVAFGMKSVGADKAWAIRAGMPPGPLDPHLTTLHTLRQGGRGAVLECAVQVVSAKNGRTTRYSEVTFEFTPNAGSISRHVMAHSLVFAN